MHGFNGIWVPLVTPFLHHEIDFPALQGLARRIAAAKVAGLVVCGSTGEAAALNDTEQLSVLDAVIDAVPGCPVVMGLAGTQMDAVFSHLASIQRRPVAGLLVPPPCYIRPSQAGIVQYFELLADAARVPLILYNIPYRTGVDMTLETIRTLAQHPRITAIKDCGGDPWLTLQLIADGEMQVLAGEDHQIFSSLCLGAAGAIAASAHIHPEWFVRLGQLIEAGELEMARQLFHRLLPLIRLLFVEPNPAPVKALLAHQGLMDGALRLPMQSASRDLQGRLVSALQLLEEPEISMLAAVT